jgi:hypothetical protein
MAAGLRLAERWTTGSGAFMLMLKMGFSIMSKSRSENSI